MKTCSLLIKKAKNKGISLLEIIVVVALVSMSSVIVVSSLSSVNQNKKIRLNAEVLKLGVSKARALTTNGDVSLNYIIQDNDVHLNIKDIDGNVLYSNASTDINQAKSILFSEGMVVSGDNEIILASKDFKVEFNIGKYKNQICLINLKNNEKDCEI